MFPEYGITGFFPWGTRDSIVPFLEVVPNDIKPVVNPCVQREYSDRPVQKRLSCLAKKYAIIIVADLATKQPCEQTDPHCPKDGRYQFNSALAYGADGALLAIYHKANLYSEESYQFDSGSRTSNIGTSVFSTNFGTFSLFICFDILFDYPSKYFKKFQVDSVAFPTAWMNELPLLSAIEYQQAWSLGMGMNLLASNQHLPLEQMTGSGIYSWREGAISYHYDMDTYKGKLLVADLPCFPSKIMNRSSNVKDGLLSEGQLGSKPISVHRLGTGNITERLYKPSNVVFKEGNSSMALKAAEEKSSKIKTLINQTTDFKKNDFFTSLVNGDPFTLQLLIKSQDTATVAYGDLICALNYSLTDTWQKGDWYAFGAFSGLHVENGQYFVQACVLLRCASAQRSKCGAETSEAYTHFKEFSLDMKGYSKDTFLTPEILSEGDNLPKKGLAWDTNRSFDKLWSNAGSLKDPLLMAGIYGRLYEKD